MGGYADRISAKKLSTLVIFGLIVFVFLMANNTSIWALVFIILGLRFFGQGMLGHISMVFCGKWFFKNKGKAVAVANSMGTDLLLRDFIFSNSNPLCGWLCR